MLHPGAIYAVRGKIGFSRITRQTTDAERERDNTRKKIPVTRNYTNCSIYDAQVIAQNPQAPTIEEQYAIECLYHSAKPEYTGNNFSAMNKSKNLPAVGVIDTPHGASYTQIIPAHELAQGLDVTLIMRVFAAKGNTGVSLDRVLVNEPIRYYENTSDVDKALAGIGVTFTAMAPAPADSADVAANTDDTAAEEDEQSATPAQPTVMAGINGFSAQTVMPATPAQAATPFAAMNAPANAQPGQVTFGTMPRQY